MKVPVYRSQTALPERTGAGQLSVQASPSALGAVGAAQFGFGQIVETEGQRWLKDFKKTDHALALADETAKVHKLIKQTNDKALTQPVGFWLDNNNKQMGFFDKRKDIERDLNQSRMLHLRNISNRRVRQSMAGVWASAIPNARTQINATIRSKYMSFAKGEMMAAIDADLKMITMMKETPAKDLAIKGLRTKIEGFHNLAPFIGDDYMFKQYKNLDSSIGEITIRQQISTIKTAKDAEDWIKRINKPGKKDIYLADILRLQPKKKQQLLESLGRQSSRLEIADNNSRMRGARNAEWEENRDENNLADDISNRISAVRHYQSKGVKPTDEEWPKNAEGNAITMPSLNDIEKAKIKPEKKKTLRAMWKGEDRVYNMRHVDDTKIEIWDAFTEHDLDLIERSVRQDRDDNTIGGKAFGELTKEIKNKRDNTPEAVERQRYTKMIDHAFKSAMFVDFTGRASHEKGVERRGARFESIAGKQEFARQIAEGELPARAFYNVMEKFQENRELVAASQIKTIPDGYLTPDIVSNPKLLQTKHIDIAMEKLRHEARGFATYEMRIAEAFPGQSMLEMSQEERGEMQRAGELSKRDRRSVRQLLATEAALRYLREYAKGNAAPVDPAPAGSTGAGKPPANSGGADKPSMMDELYKKMFGGN